MNGMWRVCAVSLLVAGLAALAACVSSTPNPVAKEAPATPAAVVSDAARSIDEVNKLSEANFESLRKIRTWRETHEQAAMGERNDYVAEFVLPDRGRSRLKDGDWATISVSNKRFEKQKDGTWQMVDITGQYKITDFVPRLLVRSGVSPRTGDNMQTVVSGQEKIGSTTYRVTTSQFRDLVAGLESERPETPGVVMEKHWVDAATNLVHKREWKFVAEDSTEKYREVITYEYDLAFEIEAPPM